MKLNEAEKKDFLQRIEELLDIDVITSQARDEIYRILIVACGRALRAEAIGDDDCAKQV